MRQQEMNRIEALEASEQNDVLAHVKSHASWLDKEIEKLEGDIDDHIDRHPQLKADADLITSIPGLGRTTAAKVLAPKAIIGAVMRKLAHFIYSVIKSGKPLDFTYQSL